MDDFLGFIIWGKTLPQFVAPGNKGSFVDGDIISIIHSGEEFDYHNDVFSIEIIIAEMLAIKHSFQLASLSGVTLWLLADPTIIAPNGSLTHKFIDALCQLPIGEIRLNLGFYVNQNIVNRGTLTYISTGNHMQYQKLRKKYR